WWQDLEGDPPDQRRYARDEYAAALATGCRSLRSGISAALTGRLKGRLNTVEDLRQYRPRAADVQPHEATALAAETEPRIEADPCLLHEKAFQGRVVQLQSPTV